MGLLALVEGDKPAQVGTDPTGRHAVHPHRGGEFRRQLPNHPDHRIAATQMSGFGGMLSFELREPSRMDAVLEKLRIAAPALSLGGVETLICAPGRTSHRRLSREEREKAGISDGLLRVSVGIEDIEDLVADFEHALGK